MYLRFDDNDITEVPTHRAFTGKKTAYDKMPHDEWVQMLKDAAAVTRKMCALVQTDRTIPVRVNG